MSDINSEVRPQDSVSQAGSRASNTSATKIQALKIKLAYQQRRARMEQEHLQQTQALDLLKVEEDIAVAEAEAELEKANDEPPHYHHSFFSPSLPTHAWHHSTLIATLSTVCQHFNRATPSVLKHKVHFFLLTKRPALKSLH